MSEDHEPDHDHDEECMHDAKMKKNLLDKETGVADTGCCSNCLRCLSGISCRTLSAFVLMLIGIGGFAGGFIIGIKRSRDLIDSRIAKDDWTVMPSYMEFIIMGVCIGTGVFGLLFFIVGSLSSGWTSRHVWNTSKKNACARALNVLCLVLAFLLHLGWQAVTCVLMTPVVLLSVIWIVNEQDQISCLNLQYYGFPKMKSEDCNNAYKVFVSEGQDVLICWAVAVVSAIIVVFSLAFFIACMGSDFRHLQETKFATYNSYEKADGRGNSQESVLDTKM